MLNGIRIFTTDDIWRKLLSDLGAVITAESDFADVNLDTLDIPDEVSSLDLKSLILKKINESHKNILNKIFNRPVALSYMQTQILVLLFQTGGISAADLKSVLGYAPDITTNAIDTAIYNLRRMFGREFIKLEQGKYCLGEL